MVHTYARSKFWHKMLRRRKVVLSSPHLRLTLSSYHSHHKNYLIPYTCHFWSIHSIGLVPAPAVGGLAGSSIKIWITSAHNHQCQLLNMRQLCQRIKQKIYFAINLLFNVLLSQASNWPRKDLLVPVSILALDSEKFEYYRKHFPCLREDKK